MQVIEVHNKQLYAGILVSALFLVVAGLGPGFFSAEFANPSSWQYQFFSALCHQIPDRSFSYSGIQMAVCARCIGIYGSFLAGIILMPAFSVFNFSKKTEKYWLIGAILLNLIDIIGNYFSIWTNSDISRILLGSLFGLSLAVILSREFFTLNKSE